MLKIRTLRQMFRQPRHRGSHNVCTLFLRVQAWTTIIELDRSTPPELVSVINQVIGAATKQFNSRLK
jgi:hypothetical protein